MFEWTRCHSLSRRYPDENSENVLFICTFVVFHNKIQCIFHYSKQISLLQEYFRGRTGILPQKSNPKKRSDSFLRKDRRFILTTPASKIYRARCGKYPFSFGETEPRSVAGGRFYRLPLTFTPAAFATIKHHLNDLNREPEEYDLIITGDLGQVGKELLLEMARKEGMSLGGRLTDCGTLVFDSSRQDVHSGGSGCGCSAITLCGHFLDELSTGKLHKILFCGTGALLSPTSTQQGLPVPGVCHAVVMEGGK